MYTPSEVQRGISHPRLALYELNRLYHQRGYRWTYNWKGIDIFDEEWDSLIILDACRFDMFEQYNTLPGELTPKQSRGSSTVDFLQGNFAGKSLLDTVYVTANPQLYRNRDMLETSLHAIIDIWQEDGWHDELGTVLPETTTEYAKRAADRYPNKRLIVHFIQPHYPFIDAETSFDKGQLEDPEIPPSFWKQMQMNELQIPADRIWEAYIKNFEDVLPHVRELISALDGRTVVTSDHGNMVGERCFPIPIRGWGHPRGIYTPQLVKVPWLVTGTGNRREITEDPSDERQTVEDHVVEDRLEQLGYV
jgi:hypothetical protein